MGPNQFLEKSVHDLAFGVKFDFTHQLACVFDKFPNAGFVGIANVEGCLRNFFGDFMVEVVVFHHEILRGSGPPNDDGLNVLKVRKPIRRCVFGCPLEEIVSRLLDEPLKPLCGLTTLAVLSHDVGYEVLLNVNPFAGGDSVRCLCPVNNEQCVGFLVDEHLLKLRQLKSRIAPISERDQRLRWVIHDDVHHPALVVAHDDGTNEDGQSVFPGGFESGER